PSLTGIKFAEGYDDRYANTHTPTISGWSEAGVTIQIQIGSRSYSFTTPSNRQWHFKVPYGFISSSNTYQYITFIATDAAGNKTTQTIKFTFLKSTPVIEADISKETDTDIVGDKITSNRKPTLTGTVSCKDQTAAQISKAKVSLYINGKMYENISVDSSGKWSFELPTELDNGKTYNYTVFVTDFVGNTGSYESYITISTLSGSLDAESITGESVEQITSDNTPKLSGQSNPKSKIKIFINNNTYEVESNENGVWSWESTDTLSDGYYTYKITETTADGKTNIFTGHFTVDTKAPQIFTAKLDEHEKDKQLVSNRPDLTLKGETEAHALVTIIVAGVTYKTYANENGEWAYTFDKYTFKNGEKYTYTAIASDNAGNKKEIQGSFTLNTINVNVDNITDNGNITNNVAPTIKGKTEPDATVKLEIDGKTYNTKADKDGYWKIELKDSFNDNTYTYFVTVEKEGKINYAQADLIIDTSVLPPELNLHKDESGYITNNSTVLTGISEAFSSVTVTINQQTYTVNANADGLWEIKNVNLEEGNNEYTIYVTDKASNKSETITGNILLDTQSPVINEITVSSDSNGGIVFQGEIDDKNASVTISFSEDGEKYNVDVIDGKWSYKHSGDFSEGEDRLIVEVTDKAGNITKNEWMFDKFTQTPDDSELPDSEESDDSAMSQESDKMEFTGETEENSSVTLKIGNNMYSTFSDESGRWSIVIDSLPEGKYNYDIAIISSTSKTVLDEGTVDLTNVSTSSETEKNISTSEKAAEPVAYASIEAHTFSTQTESDELI
ncbi:TPA: Ig-like domain-containing protein, partial [Escherichia coli]|nr:hypothetical protein [Escherichia coli]